jgi:adenylate kinase family enzyme
MQRIIATIACPGAGKSTYANKICEKDPYNWTVHTFDDWRAALWPPHRRIYYDVRASDRGPNAQKLLHSIHYHSIIASLNNGFNVVAADTHRIESYADSLGDISNMFDIDIEWKFFDVPFSVLYVRNLARAKNQGHKLPDDKLKEFYDAVNSPDAWFRNRPINLEVIPYTPPQDLNDFYSLNDWFVGVVPRSLALEIKINTVCIDRGFDPDVVAEYLVSKGLL